TLSKFVGKATATSFFGSPTAACASPRRAKVYTSGPALAGTSSSTVISFAPAAISAAGIFHPFGNFKAVSVPFLLHASVRSTATLIGNFLPRTTASGAEAVSTNGAGPGRTASHTCRDNRLGGGSN